MISCIVTTYKREVDILKRAIDSIIGQTYKDIEIIIVNDAPDEKDLARRIDDLVKQYTIDIKYIIHDVNKGACAARNTGMNASKGQYIAFLDDDDEWVPEKLEKQLKKIEEDQSALVYCDHCFVDKNGSRINKPSSRENLCGDNDFEQLLSFNYIGSTSFPLIDASVLKLVGGFNCELQSSQDHEVWLKIAKNHKISYINEPLVIYHYSEAAISRSTAKREQGYTYILNEFKDSYEKNKNVLHCRYIFLSITYFSMRRFGLGFNYWGRGIAVKPMSSLNLLVFKKVFSKMIKKKSRM